MHSPKQLRAAIRGGVLLGTAATPRLVRNQSTERVLPCCWQDCWKDGDNRIQVQIPHDKPRWADPLTGNQEMLVYIFCSETHKQYWIQGLRHASGMLDSRS